MWQSEKIFNFFNTLTLKLIFWKTKTLLKGLGYRFLAESTKIENASFPYKTAISEASVKRNRMVTTKWIYHEERSFASNYFNFWKFYTSLSTSYKELICCTNNTNAHICTFCKRWSFIWRCFSLWVSLNPTSLWIITQYIAIWCPEASVFNVLISLSMLSLHLYTFI